MARLDPLLMAMVQHAMDTLALEPGSLPRLIKGDASHDVTKTPLDSKAIRVLLREVAPGGKLPEGGEFEYRLGDNDFWVEISEDEEACRATFRLAAVPRGESEGLDPTPDAVGAEASVAEVGAAASWSESDEVDEIEPEDEAFEEEDLGDPTLDEMPPPFATVEAADGAAEESPPEEASGEEEALPAGIEAHASAEDELPEMRRLLALMVETGASDLHLSAGQVPRARVDGGLDEIPGMGAASSGAIERVLSEILPARSRKELEAHLDADFAFQLDAEARFRVNVFHGHRGLGAVFRRIPARIPSFEELGLPESLRRLAELGKGLVLVTGPTGSGKSTTLAALLDRINETRREHILTIEDPIEFVHTSKGCLVNQREVGPHAESFQRAVRAALREDPDIVLVGEMRDLETVAIAIETAETGHLVFGTLHTTTAASTIERVVGQFPGDRQGQIRMMLAGSLQAVVAQTLLRKIGGGRVAAFEVLISTPAVANLIREGKTFQIGSAMQTGRAAGMTTLTDSLFRLVEEGIVEPQEAYAKAVDKSALAEKLGAAGHAVNRLAEGHRSGDA